MSGFGWTPPSYPPQPGAHLPPYSNQPGAPPPYQGIPPATAPHYYLPQGGFAVHEQMQAGRYAPSYSQSVTYSDSSDDEDRKGKHCTYYWKKSSVDQTIPVNAVVSGRDLDGSVIYVGKAKFESDKLPAKIIPERRYASVSHNGREHSVKTYKVLCEHGLRWIKSSNGNVPEGAVQGGKTKNGETLYVGRANVQGAMTVGKVHRSHGCIYIPFGGEERSLKEYEVLVQT